MLEFVEPLSSGRYLYVDNVTGEWVVEAEELGKEEYSTPPPLAPPVSDDLSDRCPVLVVYKLTHKCNYSCDYCYDAQHTNRLSIKGRNESIRILLHRLLNTENRKVGLVFHGGEPLLQFDEVKAIISEFENPKNGSVEFGLQTNGSLLTADIIKYLQDHQVSITVSLDGSNALTNYIRGPKVFTEVYEQLVLLSQKKILDLSSISLTITVGDHNVRQLRRSIIDFQEAGFRSVSFSPIHGVNDQAVGASPEALSSAYLEILDGIFEHKIRIQVSTIIQWVMKIVTGKSSLRCISRDCGVGESMKVVNPDGEISPCDSIFTKQYDVSILNESLESVQENKKNLVNKRITPDCSSCSIRAICPGPCPGNVILDEKKNRFTSTCDECIFLYSWITNLIDRLANPLYGNKVIEYCMMHQRKDVSLQVPKERYNV